MIILKIFAIILCVETGILAVIGTVRAIRDKIHREKEEKKNAE